MRHHIQGVALLALLAAVLWGTAKMAGPVLSDAFGDDGALQAQSSEDRVELSAERDDEPEAPLTSEEVFTIQWVLSLEGFLDPDSDIDGLMGPTTRGAMTEAKAAYGIDQRSDRDLLAHLRSIFEQQTAPTTATP